MWEVEREIIKYLLPEEFDHNSSLIVWDVSFYEEYSDHLIRHKVEIELDKSGSPVTASLSQMDPRSMIPWCVIDVLLKEDIVDTGTILNGKKLFVVDGEEYFEENVRWKL